MAYLYSPSFRFISSLSGSTGAKFYLPYLTLASCHTEESIKKVYADKGYYGEPNGSFLNLNEIEDGIMRRDTKRAKITEIEIERNKKR